MEGLIVKIYTKSSELPQMEEHNFFQSSELFRVAEESSGNTPLMAVAFNENGAIIGHLLATVRRRGSWLPPYLYTHARIYSEGEYAEGVNKQQVFAELLSHITRRLKRKMCLYIEFSDISKKMFGYKHFRANGYFPVHWQEIHNSLHSRAPIERLSKKNIKRIQKAKAAGVETHEVTTKEEVHQFYQLLHGFYRMKLRRYISSEQHFSRIYESDNARIFLTTYKNKVIGGCLCIYSNGNAYLWYLASKRKSYPKLHPNTMTVWHAIQYAYEHNYAHIFFMDVGLPWKRNPFRNFILSFGGKPVSSYRWFRFNIGWINRILKWIYKE